MTIYGDQSLNSLSKIHSIVKLDGNTFKSFSTSVVENMAYTTVSTMANMATTTGNMLDTLNLNGPSFKVDLEGVTSDLTVTIKAKPAYKDIFEGDKKFEIKNIEDSWVNTLKNLATPEKKPTFTVNTATDIEEYLQITGAVVDLTITGEMKDFFTLKGRKAGPISFPTVNKETTHTRLQKFDNLLVSVFNGKQLQFNYMPT
jgi:hypothetical protein